MAYPSVAKCTMAFQQRLYGWTENYYLDNPSSDLVAEMTKLETLTSKRIPMSGAQTYISWLKVSNEAKKRDVLPRYYGGLGDGAWQGTSVAESDAQNTAFLIRRVGTDNATAAPLYMRGIWDKLVILGGDRVTNDAAWNGFFNSYKAELVDGGWGFLGKSSATLAPQDLTAVLQRPDGRVDLTVGAPLFDGTQNGKRAKVFVSGVTGAAALNGTLIVNVTSLTTATTVNRIPIFDWSGGGKMTNTLLAFIDIANVQTGRVVERKAGRPLYLSRGRARGRKVS